MLNLHFVGCLMPEKIILILEPSSVCVILKCFFLASCDSFPNL